MRHHPARSPSSPGKARVSPKARTRETDQGPVLGRKQPRLSVQLPAGCCRSGVDRGQTAKRQALNSHPVTPKPALSEPLAAPRIRPTSAGRPDTHEVSVRFFDPGPVACGLSLSPAARSGPVAPAGETRRRGRRREAPRAVSKYARIRPKNRPALLDTTVSGHRLGTRAVPLMSYVRIDVCIRSAAGRAGPRAA